MEAIRSKFAFSGDKAVANATTVTGYERAQSEIRHSSSLEDQNSRRWADSRRASLVLYFVVDYQRILENGGLQVFLRAPKSTDQ